MSSKFGSTVSVENFDEVRLLMRQELSGLAAKLEKSLRSTDNDPLKINTIRELLGLIKLVTQIFNDIQFSPKFEHTFTVPDVIVPEIKVPNIYVPEMKAPVVNVAAPNITVKPTDVIIDFDKLRDIFSPIQDLLEQLGNISTSIGDIPKHQDTFLESLAKESNRNLSNLSAVFSGGPTGMSKDEFIAAFRQLNRTSSATNTFATVGVASGTVIAANGSRVSLTLVNDSSNKIYIAKGATAVSGSGILLSASGGAITIDDYTGIVSAIATGAGSNLTICEVS